MKKKFFKNILILGNSPKFIDLIKRKVNFRKIKIIKWRKMQMEKNFSKYNLILVCGYDYSLLTKNYEIFYKNNVLLPIKIISKSSTSKTKIIYINTLSKNKSYTLSRYEFSKNELASLITQSFKNYNICNLGVIIDNGKVLIKGGKLLKFLYKFLIFLRYLDSQEISKINFFNEKGAVKKMKIYFAKISRNFYFDKLLRIF